MLPELRSSRLVLRPARVDDVDALWNLWTEPGVRRFLFDEVAIPRERAAEILYGALAMSERGLGLWTLHTHADVTLLGCVALLPVTVVGEFEPRLAGNVEVLVALASRSWHQGYATEALRAAIAYAFDEVKLPRLAAAADVPNTDSHRLLARLGFEMLSECPGPVYAMRTYTLRKNFDVQARREPDV